jgi:hypothetical protein
MHHVVFTPPLPVPAQPGPALPQTTALPELGQVVLAEHARILRLFTALEDLRAGSGQAVLGRAWGRLADLLEVHADAEEEIYYEVVYGQGSHIAAIVDNAIADHDDIRAAVAEANLAEAGSECWWRAVAGAHRACAEHFASEEQQLLALICAHLTPEAGRLLARQWATFTATQRSRLNEARQSSERGAAPEAEASLRHGPAPRPPAGSADSAGPEGR